MISELNLQLPQIDQWNTTVMAESYKESKSTKKIFRRRWLKVSYASRKSWRQDGIAVAAHRATKINIGQLAHVSCATFLF